MIRNDYILRMIELMGQFLRRLQELTDEHERKLLLNKACTEHCGMPFETLISLPADTLIHVLQPAPRFLASEMLFLSASFRDASDLDTRQERLLKSLRLLLSLKEEGQLCEERWKRVSELENEFRPCLNPAELLDCAAFYFSAGAYDLCEDDVFRAAAQADASEKKRIVSAGLTLLRRACMENEQDLALCNLSREELLESIRDLQTMYS